MSLQDLSLPVDVPWKLIATSRDMLASKSNPFPNAMWKSSLAIFAFDPDLSDMPEQFPDREITFIKVVCSVTSYVPAPLPHSHFNESPQSLDTSFPCYGALVQVAVYPKQENNTNFFDISDLAYFLSFQPQKRELTEVVTESGESMTQSKSGLNVRKGVTSTDSVEDMDVLTGVSVKATVLGSGGETGVTGQWGTVKKSTTDRSEVTTADSSRESREGSSHTTSMSQLYHLLNSYHVGTNRAIFFQQPRPHTVQQKDQFTFIGGPQEIEGVQEFFLVLSRPKGKTLAKDYCVDALLLTAHLDPDETQAALAQPKTAESQWTELLAASPSGTGVASRKFYSRVMPPPDKPFSHGFPPAPSPFDLPKRTPKEYGDDADTRSLVFTGFFNGFGGIDRPPWPPFEHEMYGPAILDEIFSAPLGWKIDRTRGLGGYDLWEDPDNRSGTVYNEDSPTKIKPQAFIDIIAIGDPNNATNYRPDVQLRIRAYVWPSYHNFAIYHARIKVYYIQHDLPSTPTLLPMIVTAREATTCNNDSTRETTNALTVRPLADIIAEGTAKALNIAPFKGPSQALVVPAVRSVATSDASSGVGSDSASLPISQSPINSARPSGLDPSAIGIARAKMANSLANDVGVKLKTSLINFSNNPALPIEYLYTDIAFQKLSSGLLASEVQSLASAVKVEQTLVKFVLNHPRFSTIATAGTLALALNPSPEHSSIPTEGPLLSPLLSQSKNLKPSKTRATEAPVANTVARRRHIDPVPHYAVITLASPRLAPSSRKLLRKAGIISGLDLVGVAAAQLAHRLGIGEMKARTMRLQVLGLNIPPQPKRVNAKQRRTSK